jgi:hypothetical protein
MFLLTHCDVGMELDSEDVPKIFAHATTGDIGDAFVAEELEVLT